MRGYGWENAIDTVLGDLRYALRRLRSAPGFTIITVLTLAVGIGATTAIFGAVNPILFEPLPYPDPGRLVMVSDRDEAGRGSTSRSARIASSSREATHLRSLRLRSLAADSDRRCRAGAT